MTVVQSAANSNARLVTDLTSLYPLTESQNQTLNASTIPVGQHGKQERVTSNVIWQEGVTLQPYVPSLQVAFVGYLLQVIGLAVPALYLGASVIPVFLLITSQPLLIATLAAPVAFILHTLSSAVLLILIKWLVLVGSRLDIPPCGA